MVSELEGMKPKNKIDPCGVNFDPSGSKLTWHMCHTRMHVPCKFWVCATPLPSNIFSNALSARMYTALIRDVTSL